MYLIIRRFLLIAVPLLVIGGLGYGLYAHRENGPLQKVGELTRAGDLRQAQLLLRTEIAKAPNDPALHLALARTVSKLADPYAAQHEFERAIALGADTAETRSELGETLLLQGKVSDALRLIPELGTTPSATAKNLLLRSIAQISLNDVAGAEATLETARRVAPDAPDTFLIAARLAALRGNAAAVESNIDAVLKRDPDQIEALLMREQLLNVRGDRDAALKTVDRAIAVAPWSAMARTDRAYLLMFKGEDAKAKQDVDAILASQPRFTDAIYLRGVLLARQGNFAEASTQLSRLDGAGPRFPQVLYYQALVAQALRQNEAAAEYARRYNQIAPGDPDGARLRATTALAVGDPASAAAALEALVAKGTRDPESLLLLARARAAADQPDAAAALLREVAAQNPSDPVVLGQLGAIDLAGGRLDQAFGLLDRAQAARTDDPAILRPYALAAIQMHRFDVADSAIARLRRATQDTEAADTLAGLLAHEKGDVSAAREAWLQVSRTFPKSVDARIYLARALKDAGETQAATTMLNQVLAAQPANTQALLALLTLLPRDSTLATDALQAAHKAAPAQPLITAMLADNLTGQGKAAAALDVLAAGQAPATPILQAAAGRAHAAAGQHAAAVTAFRAALDADPRDDQVLDALAVVLQRSAGPDAVVSLFRDSLARRPNELLPMSRLVQYVGNNKGVDAGLAVAAELRSNPANMPYAAVLRGDLLAQQRRFADAADAYGREYAAMRTRPLLMRLVAARSAAGQYDPAAAALTEWLAANPGTPDVLRALGQLDMRAGREAQAAEHFRAALAKQPTDAVTMNNLAWAYLALKDARALPTARAAFTAAPTPEHSDTLGWVLLQGGSVAEAIQFLTAANRQRPEDGTIAFHLATALDRASQPDKAAVLLKATMTGPDFPERADAGALLSRIASAH